MRAREQKLGGREPQLVDFIDNVYHRLLSPGDKKKKKKRKKVGNRGKQNKNMRDREQKLGGGEGNHSWWTLSTFATGPLPPETKKKR